jgi:hypothetical protein
MDAVYSILAIALLWFLFLIVTRQTGQATKAEEALASIDALLGEEKALPMDLAGIDFKAYMEKVGVDLKADGYIKTEEHRKRKEESSP